jgi:hypothetical protein
VIAADPLPRFESDVELPLPHRASPQPAPVRAVFRDASKDDRISAEVAVPPSKPRRAIRPLVSATTRPVTVVMASPAPRRAQPMHDSEPSVVIRDSAPDLVAPPSDPASVPSVATAPPATTSPEKRAAGKWTELISASVQAGTRARAAAARAAAEAPADPAQASLRAQPELGAPSTTSPVQPVADRDDQSGAADPDSARTPVRMTTAELARLLERQKRRLWVILGGGVAVLLGVGVWAWLSRKGPSSLPEPSVASAPASEIAAAPTANVAASPTASVAAALTASVAAETEDADTVLPSEALPLEQPSDRGRGKHRKTVGGGRAAPTSVASFPPTPPTAPAPAGAVKTPIVRHAPF